MREYNIFKKILPLKAVLLDVDGVMTPGGIWYSDSGDQFKRFDVRDGLGLIALSEVGIRLGIITGKQSKLLEKRASELRIEKVYQKTPFKVPALTDFAESFDLKLEEIAFIGDDVIDIPAMELCGFSACPGDAPYTVKRVVDWQMRASAGFGALREISELIIAAKGTGFPADDILLDWARKLSFKS